MARTLIPGGGGGAGVTEEEQVTIMEGCLEIDLGIEKVAIYRSCFFWCYRAALMQVFLFKRGVNDNIQERTYGYMYVCTGDLCNYGSSCNSNSKSDDTSSAADFSAGKLVTAAAVTAIAVMRL